VLRLEAILGRRDDPRFAGRSVDELPVTWAEAGRRRLRRATASGRDVAVDLPRGAFLADGAVLDDDGTCIVAVARTREPALVIRLSEALSADERVRCAALLGHAFGNQHVPVDCEDGNLRVPLTTSEAVGRATVEALALAGVTVTVEDVALARRNPLHATGHDHG
jgi:urease accessory protein